MNTQIRYTVETQFLQNGEVRHVNTLGAEFVHTTLKGLAGRFGGSGWTTRTRTITTTVETSDWS